MKIYCLIILLLSANLSYANSSSLLSSIEEEQDFPFSENIINMESEELDDTNNILLNELEDQPPQDIEHELEPIDQGLEARDVEGEGIDVDLQDNEKSDDTLKRNIFDIPANTNDQINKDEEKNYNSSEESKKETQDPLEFSQLEPHNKVDRWEYKKIPNRAIYNKQHNNNLPKAFSIQDYQQQIFYCIAENNVSGLRAVINKLEDIGIDDVLTLKKSGESLLTYAVKANSFDVTRFLLHKGVDFSVADNDREALLAIARKKGYFGIVNTIVAVKNISYKTINNNSDMYKWAMEVKSNLD